MFSTKWKYWLAYTKSCVRVDNSFLDMARDLEGLGFEILASIGKTEKGRQLLLPDRGGALFMGVLAAAVSYHATAACLALSNYGQNGWVILRPQLEATLILLYFIDSDSVEEIEEKLDAYSDWVIAKGYYNGQRSESFEAVRLLDNHEASAEHMEALFDSVRKKYESDPDRLRRIRNSPSFLGDKRAVAEKYDITELYLHVFAESSFSIHAADAADRAFRIANSDSVGYEINTHLDDSFWMLMLSNLIAFRLCTAVVEYFDLEPIIGPVVGDVAE